tara:strand:- start:4821 stop:5915 length:1095 start_codon:yes stop_codon:yes gene_type:complete
MIKKYIISFSLILASIAVKAQTDTSNSDDFDFSDFELAAPAEKAFCNNKVLGQSPTSLIGLFYNLQGGHQLNSQVFNDGLGNELKSNSEIKAAHEFSLMGNFPLLSRNSILINLNAIYQEQRYTVDNSSANNPFNSIIENEVLRRSALIFTVFKPLNNRTFLLGQIGAELNGNYSASNSNFETPFIPAALLYGWKPSDRLMYGFGVSRTYLGGALNYLPVVYYYHTFVNEKWGVEALLPARAMIRYRFNSEKLLSFGYNFMGASYALTNFGTLSQEIAPSYTNLVQAQDVQLRRSGIRAGFNYQQALSGFIWLSIEAGYRINYSYNVDEGGDFLRLLGDDTPFFMENEFTNPLYFTIGLSYVSP